MVAGPTRRTGHAIDLAARKIAPVITATTATMLVALHPCGEHRSCNRIEATNATTVRKMMARMAHTQFQMARPTMAITIKASRLMSWHS